MAELPPSPRLRRASPWPRLRRASAWPWPWLRRTRPLPPLWREHWIATAIVLLVVLLRSLVFVFWEQSYFDSDQAIIGLMGKHLIEGRAFPLFYYGQHYMLGVEAYLAAPFFAVAGISVTTLKLPLLLLNLTVALLLLRVLEREAGLRPRLALVPRSEEHTSELQSR